MLLRSCVLVVHTRSRHPVATAVGTGSRVLTFFLPSARLVPAVLPAAAMAAVEPTPLELDASTHRVRPDRDDVFALIVMMCSLLVKAI